MDVSSTSAASPATTKTAALDKAADADATAGAPAGDFETFLTLLTTQLRNQDPLKPMESTEFVAQLASFSAVEQQVRTNDRLEQIFQALSGGSADGLAEWIGKEVRAPVKGVFDGAPVDVQVTPVADADRAILVVRNDFDQVVARRELDPAAALATWDGRDDLGQAAPYGSYAFTLESFKGDTPLETQTGRVYAGVTEVRLENGTPSLVLAGGGQVALSEITGVR